MGEDLPGKDMTCRIEIEQALKGETPDTSVSFTFFLPDILIGAQKVQIGPSRIFFLNHTENKWTFTTLYRTSSIGRAVQSTDLEDAMERVLASIAAVIPAPDSSTEQKLEALYELNGVYDRGVINVLHTALADPNAKVQVSAVADLLRLDDVSVLDKAQSAFDAPPNQVPEYLLHNLAYSISVGVKTEKVVPALRALMHARFTEARRAAAQVLGRTHDFAAVVALVPGLEDPDFEVRYETVNALATITGQSEWTTNLSSYRRDETSYLKYWRGWVKEH